MFYYTDHGSDRSYVWAIPDEGGQHVAVAHFTGSKRTQAAEDLAEILNSPIGEPLTARVKAAV
jgi:hypothetical protein